MEYLDFGLTRDDVKPINKKIEAITNMKPPTPRKEVRKFMDVINYYHNMWPRRSHALSPLTRLTYIKRKFKWTKVEKNDLNKIKPIVARNNLSTYPDFNETFKIHTIDSAFQLGVVISQKGKTIALYSRKLTDAQQRYTVTERELLSIVVKLKEFRTILLGHTLRIHTDHKKLTCKIFNTDRVLIWRLILEEYDPDIEYTKGDKNTISDALSRLALNGNEETTQKSTYQEEIVSEINDIEELPEGNFPINLKLIQRHQQA